MASILDRKNTEGKVIGWWIATTSQNKRPYFARSKGWTRDMVEIERLTFERNEKEVKIGRRSPEVKTITGKKALSFEKFCHEEYLPSFIKAGFGRTLPKKTNHIKHLNKVFAQEPISSSGQKLIELWGEYRDLRRLEDRISANTLQNEWASFKAVFNYAVSANFLPANPIQKWTWEKDRMVIGAATHDPEIQTFTPDELLAIYEASDPLYAAVWRFMVHTGLRRGELLTVRKEDVGKNLLRIVHNPKKGQFVKGNRTRKVPLSDEAVFLRATILRGNPDGDLFFPKHHETTWSKKFKDAKDGAGLAWHEGTLHSLRHTFLSALASQGTPLPTVQEIAGHRDIRTTMKYIHTTSDDLIKATKNLKI